MTEAARDAYVAEGLSAPVGPFSTGAYGNGLLFMSGQVGQDPSTGALVSGGAAEQADRVLQNLTIALEAVRKSLADVVRVGVYLADMSDFAAVNEVYGRYFTTPFPARTAIQVAALPLGAAVEMDAVVA